MFYSLTNRLRTFMAGRYGFDMLGSLLLVLYLILNYLVRFILNTLLRRGLLTEVWWVTLLRFLPMVVLGWALWRVLSKNIPARCAENGVFMEGWSRLKMFFTRRKDAVVRWKSGAEERKTHRFFACPNCGQQVRVPKGKGKIAIKCPRCHQEFVKKT